MNVRLPGYRKVALSLWLLTILAIVIWSFVPGYVVGWDLQVYQHALLSLRLGHDPYADGIAVQRIFHNSPMAYQPGVAIPYTYVYSPITLPLLHLLSRLPLWTSGIFYWLLYAAAATIVILIGLRFVEEDERPIFALVAPAVIFFPGLLQNDVLFSGNIAFILYGLILSAAWLGWQRDKWAWFYVAVLAASCFKAPLLYVLAIPVLSARKQWLPVSLTGIVGIGLFAIQPWIWPSLFHNYLQAVELQFSYNHDFSGSPAGLAANALYNAVPYRITSAVAYLLYTVPICCVLLYLRPKFLAGRVSRKQWIPAMLVGVVLLNPRIMEYDVPPFTLLMALVAWRGTRGMQTTWQRWVTIAILFAVANVGAHINADDWRLTEGCLLLFLFVVGAYGVTRVASETNSAAASS